MTKAGTGAPLVGPGVAIAVVVPPIVLVGVGVGVGSALESGSRSRPGAGARHGTARGELAADRFGSLPGGTQRVLPHSTERRGSRSQVAVAAAGGGPAGLPGPAWESASAMRAR